MADGYRFRVLGPFTVLTLRIRSKRGIDFSRARQAVFDEAEAAVGDSYEIKRAIGCYIFGLSPPGGSKTWPYYVGKACDQTLYKRVFQMEDKPRVYNEILAEYEAARPFVYLLPLLTPSGRAARLKSNAGRIQIAEQELIGMALRVNTDLWNVQHRMALESFTIDGITTTGRTTDAAIRLRTMLDRTPKQREKRGKLAPSLVEPV